MTNSIDIYVLAFARIRFCVMEWETPPLLNQGAFIERAKKAGEFRE
jgi:hypothetical protein